MLIPFSMFSLDSDQGKVKYSPLYGRGSKVTILVGRHFNQECCQSKERPKKRSSDTFLLEIGDLTKKCTSLMGLPYPPHGQFYESASKVGTKLTPY